jgi:ubiquinone/menaquinone biosynthesis C-methylase UbiE
MPTWDELFKDGKFSQREPTRAVREFADLLHKKSLRRVLDLGCGAGRHLVYLAKEDFEVYGIDSSKEALEISRRRLEEAGLSAELVQADMTQIPYPNSFFEAVIAIAVLYHNTLDAMRRAVGEIHRVLKPKGLALLEFKSKRSFRYGKGQEIELDTFIAESGEDFGIPHHYSNRKEVEELTKDFIIHQINHMEQIFEEVYHSSRWEVWVEKSPSLPAFV